jgi:predicted RNA-binding protein YlqC (UPF0109 family)
MDQVKDLIIRIAQALVEHPEQVSVEVTESQTTTVFELSVAKADLGKIIGKHGITAGAIRTILNGIAGKTHKRLMLEILE